MRGLERATGIDARTRFTQAVRRSGAAAEEETEEFLALGDNLRRQFQERATENQQEALRNVITPTLQDTPNPDEVGRVIRDGARLDRAAENARQLQQRAKANPTRGTRSAATRAMNQFAREFREAFPDATDDAIEDFFNGNHPLVSAIDGLRQVGLQTPGDVFELSASEIGRLLRRDGAPLQERVEVGRSFSRIVRRQNETRRLLETSDQQVERLRRFAEDDLGDSFRVATADEQGNVQVSSVRQILDDINEDRKLVEEIADCIGGRVT